MVNHNIQKPRRVDPRLFGVLSYYETFAFLFGLKTFVKVALILAGQSRKSLNWDLVDLQGLDLSNPFQSGRFHPYVLCKVSPLSPT